MQIFIKYLFISLMNSFNSKVIIKSDKYKKIKNIIS